MWRLEIVCTYTQTKKEKGEKKNRATPNPLHLAQYNIITTQQLHDSDLENAIYLRRIKFS